MTLPEAAWTPAFPEPGPSAWVAFAHVEQDIEMLSAAPLGPNDRRWLAMWLSHHEVRELDATASYVYLGLGADWREQRPDGSTGPLGVTGLGSGVGPGEPPRAEPATVADLVRRARERLGTGTGTASTEEATSDVADHVCRVCGYRADEPPWGDDGQTPSYDLCPCCGVEWGYQDNLPRAAERFRVRWLAEGAPWRNRNMPTDGLATEERLSRIASGSTR